MVDFFWVRVFLKPLVIEFFSLKYNDVRFFLHAALYTMKDFFPCRNFFPRYFLAIIFFLQISRQYMFFLRHPYSHPQESNGRPLRFSRIIRKQSFKIEQMFFDQLTNPYQLCTTSVYVGRSGSLC